VPCGRLDQISTLLGKAASVVYIDCKSWEVRNIAAPEGTFVVCNSGAKHELTGGEYAELRRNCEEAAKKLGVGSLREVSSDQVVDAADRLPPREFDCAFHVTTEIERVGIGAGSLEQQSDSADFGSLMLASHSSSSSCLCNSTKELDILVDLARKHPGCLGARLTGGGFGGATINLVKSSLVPDFKRHMAKMYQEATGLVMKPMVCEIVDGAQ